MISSIGFFKQGIEIEKMEKYKLDKNAIKKFENYEFKNKEDFEEESDSDEKIFKDDILFYSTPNTEEQSYIEFQIYNEEIFIHHDIYIFDLILDSCYIENNEKYYIALATSENEIPIYNSFIKNPLLPEISLKGHESEVTTINFNKNLYSGSLDGNLIMWSIDNQKIINKINTGNEIYSMAINDFILTSKNNEIVTIYSNSLEKISELKIHNKVEKIVIKDKILVSDNAGYVYIFDKRNFNEPLIFKKIHNAEIPALDCDSDKIITGSIDKNISVLNYNLEELKDIKCKEKITSVCLCEYDNRLCVYGGENNECKMLILD